MCGILGIYPFKFNKPIDQQVKTFIQRWLFVETLVNMEERGKDATGASVLWKDGKTVVIKQPVNSTFFAINDGNVKEEYKDTKDERATFGWVMRKWSERLNVSDVAQVLGHVRAKTKGSEYDPHNNHPIIISDTIKDNNSSIGENTIVGIHNGSVRNDDEITKKHGFKRIAEVDSEIIFQLLNKHKENLNTETLTQIFDELSGLFAVLAYNTSKPNMVYGLREDRPLELGYIPQIGTVIAVSDKKYVDNAIASLERWRVREDNENKFPYISINWMTSMDTGVFTMDLDTEVTEATQVSSLVTMKKVVKKTVTTPYNNYNKTAPTTPTTAVAPLPPAAPSKPVDKRSAVVHDLTNYEKEETKDEILDQTLPITSADSALEVEVVIENESEVIDDSAEDESGFTFEQRVSMGSEFFNSQILIGERSEPTMFLNLTTDEQKTVLSKYGINLKGAKDEQLEALSHILYEAIFPEGYAFGYTDGYLACIDEEADKKVEKQKGRAEKYIEISKKLRKELNAIIKEKSEKANKA